MPVTSADVVYLVVNRKDFEELFDVIITNALKPGFFSLVPHQRPFRTLGKSSCTLSNFIVSNFIVISLTTVGI